MTWEWDLMHGEGGGIQPLAGIRGCGVGILGAKSCKNPFRKILKPLFKNPLFGNIGIPGPPDFVQISRRSRTDDQI